MKTVAFPRCKICQKYVCGPGFHPRPHWGSLQRSLRPKLRGLLLREGRVRGEERGKKRKEWEGKGGGRERKGKGERKGGKGHTSTSFSPTRALTVQDVFC